MSRTIYFSYNFYSSIKIVGVNIFGGLWALDIFRSIDRLCKTNIFQLKFVSRNKTLGPTVLGGLWALE